MSFQLQYKCDRCGIEFRTDTTLKDHQKNFCIGISNTKNRRKTFHSNDSQQNSRLRRSPTRNLIRQRSHIETKNDDLDPSKRQRQIDRSSEQQYLTYFLKQQETYKEISSQYQQLNKQEQDILLELYNSQARSKTSRFYENENEYLQRKYTRLLRTRQSLQQRLEDFISKNYALITVIYLDPTKLLREMKEQQEVNERAIQVLQPTSESSDNVRSSTPWLPRISSHHTRSDNSFDRKPPNFRNLYLQTDEYDESVMERYNEEKTKLEEAIQRTNEKLQFTNQANERLQNELIDMHKKFDMLQSRAKQFESSGSRNRFSNLTYSHY